MHLLPRSLAAFLVMIVCVALSQYLQAAPPLPSDAFAGSASDIVHAFALQSDGKILMGGEYFGILRLHHDGSVDTSFRATVGANSSILAIEIAPDGKIIVTGGFVQINGTTRLRVARLNKDGSLDTGFNPSVDGDVYALALQRDGKILIGGLFTHVNGKMRIRIARLNKDGSLDATFNPGAGANDNILRIKVQNNGKVLAAGNFTTFDHQSHVGIARLNTNGSLDATFTPNLDGEMKGLAIQPDGKILVGGVPRQYSEHGLTRLNADGSLDVSFKNTFYYYVDALAIQPDGKILVDGLTFQEKRQLMRINPDGSLETTIPTNTAVVAIIGDILVQPDGHILIGGKFDSINYKPRKNVARLNPDGSLEETYGSRGPDNYVDKVEVQKDGKLIVAGQFSHIGGAPRRGIARINTDGSLDLGFDPGTGANDTINSIVSQPDGKILIIGAFTSFNGIARRHITRLNENGSVDTTFDPGSRGKDNVRCLGLQPDGKILIGGWFQDINWADRIGIARLNNNGSIDTTFNPDLVTAETEALALQSDGKIVVFGSFHIRPYTSAVQLRLNPDGSLDKTFTSSMTKFGIVNDATLQADKKIVILINDYPSSYIKRLNPDGSFDGGFSTPNWFEDLNAFAVAPDGKLLVAGIFSHIRESVFSNLVRLNPDFSVDTTFDSSSSPDRSVEAVKIAGEKIYIGGSFTSIDGEEHPYVARLNMDGSIDPSFALASSGADAAVFALGIDPSNSAVIGGAFTVLNSESHRHIACIGGLGESDETFVPGVSANGNVFCTAVQADGNAIFGGVFTGVNGTQQNRIARLKPDGLVDPSFNTGSGANNTVYAVATQPDGHIVIGGEFTQFNGADRGHIARVDSNGSLDAFVPDAFDERVNTVAVQRDGKIVVGGRFQKVGSANARHIARLNANGSLDAAFTSTASIDIAPNAIAIQPDGKILIAGQFHTVNGITRRNIARLNQDGSLDTAFDAKFGDNQGAIMSLALEADGKILIGGDFHSINLVARTRLARLNPDGSLDRNYDPGSGANAVIDAIALESDGKLLVGGDFTMLAGIPRNHIARLSNPTAATQTLAVSGNDSITWKLGGSSPQPYQVLFEHSYDGIFFEKLGWGTPISGTGFRIINIRLPIMTNHYVRATGYVTGGLYNGSISLMQSTALVYAQASRNTAHDWLRYE